MPGLVPGIQRRPPSRWIAGTRPAMTLHVAERTFMVESLLSNCCRRIVAPESDGSAMADI